MGETNGNHRSIFSMRSTAAPPPSLVPRGRTQMAKSIARFLVAVMAVAAMALASVAGTGLAQAQTNTPTDRDVLVAFYDATSGDNWANNDNWLSDAPIGQWHGVTTGPSGRVTVLELTRNQLSGAIPAELGRLTNLQRLDLFYNRLSGEIPAELGSLTNLEWLDLSYNQLTGTIPVQLGDLTNLQRLHLTSRKSSQLTGPIPTELGSLANLQVLALGGNQLTGPIPTELGSLTNLEKVYLWRNQLTGPIPPELGSLTNLERLDLQGNQLSGEIPSELGGLSNLERLNLSGNQLSGEIPSELGSLSNLRALDLDVNPSLSGSLPGSFTGLTSLYRLDLTATGLCAPTDAAFQAWLGSIAYRYGVVNCAAEEPVSAGPPVVPGAPRGLRAAVKADEAKVALSWIAPISAGGAPITGYKVESSDDGNDPWVEVYTTTDDGVAYTDDGADNDGPMFGEGVTRYYRVSAVNSVGTGPPSNVAVATNTPTDRDVLVAFYDATSGDNWANNDNWLSDAPIGQWHGVTTGPSGRVTVLELTRNQLSGAIPAELGRLTNLQRLDLFYNRLSGEIPAELGSLTNLEWLNLSYNQLTGTIPVQLGDLTNLQWLSLTSRKTSQLTGPIPTELGSLSNLQVLGLGGNQLTGPIPTELGSLSNLEELYLWRNQLTGPIPTELGSLSNLEQLDLQGNQLSGEIPSELGGLANLRILHLSGNQLSGEIPSELGSLSNLRALELDVNPSLSGPLPGSFTGLTSLYRLVLTATGLCAPTDAAFQAWLGGIAYRDGVVNCAAEEPVSAGPPVVPGAPRGLRAAVKADEAKVALSWIAPISAGGAPITGYTVESSDDGNDPWVEVYTTTDDGVAYTDDGADNDGPMFGEGVTRYYRVSAVNSVGTGPPSNVAVARPDRCLEPLGPLTAPVTRADTWADDCPSTGRSGGYARYYSFSLEERQQVEMNLTSPADPLLYLRRGQGRDGMIEAENDNVGSRNFNSSINRVLEAGVYTVEAAPYFAGQTGRFTLSVRPLERTEDLGDLTRSVDRSNSAWTSDHESMQRPGSYARYYTFTLAEETHLVINLTSPLDPYLYVFDSDGTVVAENDNVTNRNLNSRIDQDFPAGDYTIEATTYFEGLTGSFHLSIGYFGAPQ